MKNIATQMLVMVLLPMFVLLTACGDEISPGPVTNSVEQNYSRWKRLGIDSYEITEQKICFCGDRGTKAILQISQNKIVSGTDSVTGKPISAEMLQWYKTIDQLFETAIEAKKANPANYSLQLNPSYGFPSYLYVDPNAQIADEEYGYTITNFKATR